MAGGGHAASARPPRRYLREAASLVCLRAPATEDCPEENPCCNWCSASFVATDVNWMGLAGGEVPNVGCAGDGCDWHQNCEPPDLEGERLVWGIVQQPYYVGVYLSLDGYCP